MKKNILILGIGTTSGLDDTTSTLLANTTNIYHFKAKDSGIKKHPLCLGNISEDFQPITWKEQD